MSESDTSTRFVKFDEETVNRLIDAKLTAAQYRAFLYFTLVDPFGNRPVDTCGAMARDRLGLSKSTYYGAIARLQEEELFDFDDVVLRVRNKVGTKAPEQRSGKPKQGTSSSKLSGKKIVREIEPESEKSNQSPKNRTEFREIEPESEKSETRSLEPLPSTVSGSPHDLSLSFSTSSEPSERERKEFSDSNFQIAEQGEEVVQLDREVKPSGKIEINVDTDQWDQFSAPGADPEFFQFVVARVKQFPQPPADDFCVAESWIQKQGHLLYAQYGAWIEERRRVDSLRQAVPVAVDVPPPIQDLQPTAEERLAKYRALWGVAMMQGKVEGAIASHPEWGIEIGPDGPRLIDGFVTPALEPALPLEDKLTPVLGGNTKTEMDSSPVDHQPDLWEDQTYAVG